MTSQQEFMNRRKTLVKGEVLFELDRQAETAYLVREGVLVVGCSSPNGREVITSVYFPGEVCAGLSVLTGAEYMGTARAPKKSKTVVTPLSRQELMILMADNADVYRDLLLTQRDKQRFKDRMLLGMVAESCKQRTAAALLWLHKQAAPDGPASRSYLCRQELADLIGSTVETVIRVLSQFRKNGLIQESKDLMKLDVPKLTAMALSA
jgi:CRP-like cAMP-binding protein